MAPNAGRHPATHSQCCRSRLARQSTLVDLVDRRRLDRTIIRTVILDVPDHVAHALWKRSTVTVRLYPKRVMFRNRDSHGGAHHGPSMSDACHTSCVVQVLGRGAQLAVGVLVLTRNRIFRMSFPCKGGTVLRGPVPCSRLQAVRDESAGNTREGKCNARPGWTTAGPRANPGGATGRPTIGVEGAPRGPRCGGERGLSRRPPVVAAVDQTSEEPLAGRHGAAASRCGRLAARPPRGAAAPRRGR